MTNLRQRLFGLGSENTHCWCHSLNQLYGGRGGGQVTAGVWRARPVTHLLTGGHLHLTFWWFLTYKSDLSPSTNSLGSVHKPLHPQHPKKCSVRVADTKVTASPRRE